MPDDYAVKVADLYAKWTSDGLTERAHAVSLDDPSSLPSPVHPLTDVDYACGLELSWTMPD